MEIAGGCWIHQNRPRDIAVILRSQFIMNFTGPDGCIDYEILKNRAPDIGVDLRKNAEN